MNLKNAVYKVYHRPSLLCDYIWCKLAPILPNRLFLEWHFRWCNGYKLNLNNPQTFNEKIQWLKLNDYHEEYTKMVDKVDAKDYVASVIGEQYIIRTLGVWNTVDEINWEALPNQFVIKSTNDSGGVVVCKDKAKLSMGDAKNKLRSMGGRDYSIISKEYPYKKVPRRFIAEVYIEDESGYELKDYKFFCFDGEVEFLFVATGRQQNDIRFDFYDIEFNHLPVLNGHPNADIWPVKPVNYDEMLDVAAKLSKGIPHVRVDLYNVNGKIYFGELTFFHFSGTTPFEPMEWDYKFGKYLKLPINCKTI